MPAQRLPMRQVREVLRLKHVAGFSDRRIAAATGISRYTVAEYLRRATIIGITWPIPTELDDAARELDPGIPGTGTFHALAWIAESPPDVIRGPAMTR
jgi:hypothetical protein